MMKIKELWTWFTSRKVREAINNGATYEEVCQIVNNEMQKGKKQ